MKRPRTITKLPASMLLAVCFSSTAVAQTLPLNRGEYVLESTNCGDAPNAAILIWDGVGLSGAHSTGCTSQITRRADRRYAVSTVCKAQGDGTPNAVGTKGEYLIVTRTSSTRFSAITPTGVEMAYRWCSAKLVD
jgi:hypothetical protein